MKSVYVVVDDNNHPFIVCESKQDAVLTVENIYGKSANKYNQHVYKVPFSQDNGKILNLQNTKDVIDLTIYTVLNTCSTVKRDDAKVHIS